MKEIKVMFDKEEFDNILSNAESIRSEINKIILSIKEESDLKDKLYALYGDVQSLIYKLD